MNKKYYSKICKASTFIWVFCSFILFAACTNQNEIDLTDTSPNLIQEGEIDRTSVDDNLATVVISKPIETLVTPTIASIPPTRITNTIKSTPTKQILPTETSKVEEWQTIATQVESIMSTNNGCQLPCWWGIKPGDTVEYARQVFDTIDEDGWVDSPSERGDLHLIGFFEHFYNDEVGEWIGADFLVNLLVKNDQIVLFDITAGRSISFANDTAEYNQVGDRLLRDWEQFSPQNIIEEFGKPDMIHLLPRNFADGDDFYYEFNLYYPSLGIVISYSSPLLDENGERQMCLNVSNMDSMNLYLYDPTTELPNSYLQATYSLWPLADELKTEDSSLIEFSDIESRTNMNIDEFATFVLNNEQDKICFVVN